MLRFLLASQTVPAQAEHLMVKGTYAEWEAVISSSHLEDLPARLLVGDAHGDLPSEAAARPQRRVDRLQPARRPDHEHALTAAGGGVCAALLASALSETRGVEFVDRT